MAKSRDKRTREDKKKKKAKKVIATPVGGVSRVLPELRYPAPRPQPESAPDSSGAGAS